MPTYEYQPLSGQCDQCHGVFEVFQHIADEKLTNCPSCGKSCGRRISAAALGGKWSLSESKIKESGLTQYRKVGKGQYERTVGTGGPEHLERK
jgi:putative FmdB family regulatory protein